jgi:hypothetical protein
LFAQYEVEQQFEDNAQIEDRYLGNQYDEGEPEEEEEEGDDDDDNDDDGDGDDLESDCSEDREDADSPTPLTTEQKLQAYIKQLEHDGLGDAVNKEDLLRTLQEWTRQQETETDAMNRHEDRHTLRLDFEQLMRQRFLQGMDADFDYDGVDNNTDYDVTAIRRQDDEDEYFDQPDVYDEGQDDAASDDNANSNSDDDRPNRQMQNHTNYTEYDAGQSEDDLDSADE